MKERVITALVLLCILAVVLVFLNTLLLNAVIGVIAFLAVWELLKATNLLQFKGLALLAIVQALVLPFVRAGYVLQWAIPIFFAIILGYFVLLVKNFGVLKIEHCAMAFLFSTVVPLFFSCAVHIRDDHGVAKGGFYLILALGSGWLSDTGAYFVGTFLGKHKLAPRVSPKKTVEGSIGGLVSNTVLLVAIAALYTWVLAQRGMPAAVNYPLLILFAPLFSAVGMLGDLSASAIKREYGVKDFGNLMPGHGGIMDRFDSVLFTLPVVYAVVRHVELMWFV